MKAQSYRTLGLALYSAGAHVAVVLAATLLSREGKTHEVPKEPTQWVDLDTTPPGGGAPKAASEPIALPAAPRDRVAHKAKHEDRDAPLPALSTSIAPPTPTPPSTASAAAPAASSATAAAPPGPPASAAPAASGSPGGGGTGAEGPGNGSGPPGTGSGTSSAYRARVGSWFQARISLGGSTSSDPHPLLRVGVVVTLAGRKVTGFSLTKPSGDAAYDARIDRRLRDIVGSGAELPEPEEGAVLPSQLSLSFTCKPNERCS